MNRLATNDKHYIQSPPYSSRFIPREDASQNSGYEGYYNPEFPPMASNGENFPPNHQTFPQNFPNQQYSKQPHQVPNPEFPPNLGFPNNPIMADMALRYGSTFVDNGKEIMEKELNKYVSASKVKFYFEVDTSYTFKKICRILFPYGYNRWAPTLIDGVPVSAKHDVNAPDLYIPLMAYLTYILVAGLVLGMTQGEFQPERLGILVSRSLAYLLVEVMIQLITIYVINLQTKFGTLDLLAFSGYKFIGINLVIVMKKFFGPIGYYTALFYFGISLAFYLGRILKWRLVNETVGCNPADSSDISIKGLFQGKRRLYFLLLVALFQPLLIWWISHSVDVI